MQDRAGYSANNLPEPVLDAREQELLDRLSERYLEITKPNPVYKAGKKAAALVPAKVKDAAADIKEAVSEQELYEQAMAALAQGFKIIEEQAAKFAINETTIIKGINAVSAEQIVSSIDEICLVRGYHIGKAVGSHKSKELALAFAEGAATGAPGFVGLPFNLVLSTFLFYRAVQSIAMMYGYDVKNDPEELVIAGEVYMQALSPAASIQNEMGQTIEKLMLVSKAEAVRQGVKKGWAGMAERGGVELLLTQIRALAHKAAKNALEKAGKKGLEESLFKGIFEQIGKRLTQKTIERSIPFVSGGICALLDTVQMNKVLRFSEIVYAKRFLLEKEKRIALLTNTVPKAEIDSQACLIEVEDVEVNYPSILEEEDLK